MVKSRKKSPWREPKSAPSCITKSGSSTQGRVPGKKRLTLHRSSAPSSVQMDIEEQLRRQRKKQQESKIEDERALRENPTVLGRLFYDKERDAYFPKTSSLDSVNDNSLPTTVEVGKAESKAKNNAFPFLSHNPDCHNASSHRYCYLSNICSSPLMNKRLRTSWYCRVLLESMRLTPCGAFSRKSSVLNTMFPRTFEDDLDCKINLPRWTRTFDVRPSSHGSCALDVASLVGERAVLQSGIDGAVVSVAGCTSVRMMGDSFPGHVGVLKTREYPTLFTHFSTHSSERTTLYEISAKINDFSVLDSQVIFATGVPRNQRRGPWALKSRGSDGTFGHASRLEIKEDFPQSDMMCVEEMVSFQKNSVLLGHRNGQITLLDTRRRSCLSSKDAPEFGAVSSLNSLEANVQVLARGYFGTCRLYDLRKIGSGTMSRIDSSVVHEFRVPEQLSTTRLTNKCSGIAADPTQSAVISPFVNQDEVPCLGLWSLYSGIFIGAKKLAPQWEDTTPASTSWGVSWVELCRQITPGRQWHLSKSDELMPHIVDLPDAFGLWYKCGQSMAGPVLPPAAGNIHHVYVDGHIPSVQ